MDWLKKAPTAVTVTVIITCGLLAVALVGAFVLLELEGADTTEFRQWVNTLGTLLAFPLMGVSAVAATAAARSSSRAEDQTNGQLVNRDQKLGKQDVELKELRAENAALRRERDGQ